MKTLHAILFAAALVLCAKPALAAADVLDVSELTCAQFTKYDDNNKGLIMMWLEGYYTEEDEPTAIDFGKMAGHLDQAADRLPGRPEQERSSICRRGDG